MLVNLHVPPAVRPSRRFDARIRGFTLIELVFTITVVAILAALAAPSFREFIATQRIRNASFDLMAALTLVRSEAITRNASVDLVRAGSSWSNGWTVSVGTTVLQVQQAYGGLTISDSAGLGTISYGKDGRSTTASTKFTIAPATGMAGVTSRCISIGLSGVPSTRLGAC
jgi:type IV fimbrial biogenesis protein FimT